MFKNMILTLALILFAVYPLYAQEWPPLPEEPVINDTVIITVEPFFPELSFPEMFPFSDEEFFPEGIPFAEVPPFPEESPEPGVPPDRPEKMKDKVESLRVWKLLETLDLSEEQANSFLPAYREFQKSEGKYSQTRRELLDQLQEALEDKDQKKISDLVGKLKQNRLQMEQDRVQFLAKIDKLLSAEQQAKFLLFQHQFEGRMRSEIWQMRKPFIYKNLAQPYLELELKTLNDRLQKLHKKSLKEHDFEELKARLEEAHKKAQEVYKQSLEMYQEALKKLNEMEKKETPKKSY